MAQVDIDHEESVAGRVSGETRVRLEYCYTDRVVRDTESGLALDTRQGLGLGLGVYGTGHNQTLTLTLILGLVVSLGV